MKSLIFYVQHLLGIGHLRRAALIAGACSRHGFKVTLIQGGIGHNSFNPRGVEIFQLPALKIGSGGFSDLRDSDNNPVNTEWLEHRKSILIERVQHEEPDIVLIESYPFGRRQMRFELRPLLKSLKYSRATSGPGPLIICSIRDILQIPKKSERAEETLDLLETFFHGVLVHGDANIVRLDKSFPDARQISDKLRYTGIVAPRPPETSPGSKTNRILVSAGGGAVGEQLLKVTLEATQLPNLADHSWHLITGPSLSEAAFNRLCSKASDNIIVERFRSDFLYLLSKSSLSISQCGYNTSADLLTTNTRAVVVPFAQDGETEQTMRASYLAKHNRVIVLGENELTARSLSEAIEKALMLPPPSMLPLDLNGAENTAKLLDAWN